MQPCIIYHNPKCSKSRQALELLKSNGIHPTIVEYLKTPFNLEQLVALRSHFNLKDFVRTNEPVFKQLNLNLEDETNILKAILKEPILMQRPIVILGEKAVIARPPERVLELIK
jgi:arsenate reductase (glutaredoxin)